MGSGQANVKAYNRHLSELIHTGRAKPSWIVSHELSLEEAPGAYEQFDGREDGWTKVVLHPGRSQKSRLVGHETGKRHTAVSGRNGHGKAGRRFTD
jgi:hypothetical protein